MAGCPSSHQPTRIREEMLESGGPLQRNFEKQILKEINLITLDVFKINDDDDDDEEF